MNIRCVDKFEDVKFRDIYVPNKKGRFWEKSGVTRESSSVKEGLHYIALAEKTTMSPLVLNDAHIDFYHIPENMFAYTLGTPPPTAL